MLHKRNQMSNIIVTVFIVLSSYLFDITNSNSCIIHQTPSQCNIQPRCEWDPSSSSCICGSIIPQDVIIIMDASPSMLKEGWTVEKQFIIDLISTAIPSSSSIAIIQFATNTDTPYELSDDQTNRINIIQTVNNSKFNAGGKYLGTWTMTKKAVDESINLFKNQSIYPQRQIVLITDGEPQPASQAPCDLRPELDALGAKVMVIGVGESWTDKNIECLVQTPTKDIIKVQEFTPDSFEVIRNKTDDELCSNEFIIPTMNCSVILNDNRDNTGIPSGDASWNQPNMDWSRTYALYYQLKWFTFQNDEHNIRIQATPIDQTMLTLFNMEYRNPNVYNQSVRAVIDFGNGEIYFSQWDICKLITSQPTFSPTMSPTTTTTMSPTKTPTISPTYNPTVSPSFNPTVTPTSTPSIAPIGTPTVSPTYFSSRSPSKYPSIGPTVKDPTPTPVEVPTLNPTMSPTQPPIIGLPSIDWCIVLIKDEQAYEITFSIPEDTGKITHYVITYLGGKNSISAAEVDADAQNFTELFDGALFPKNVTIDADTRFYMTNMNEHFDQLYRNWTECTVLTLAPSISPTSNPSKQPTRSPTYGDVGVFVYSDENSNNIICDHDERCACEVDRFNLECIGSDHIEGTQIEDTQLSFEPTDGEQVNVLNIGRYPYYFVFDVQIEWEFVYLNDTQDFDYGRRIKPIKGITTVKSGTTLSDIVFAEFVPMPHERYMNKQWYKFKILNCQVIDKGEEIDCYIIYPSWVYIIWSPSKAFTVPIIEGGEPFPDWIFYVLLGGSTMAVIVAYLVFLINKNRNLNHNVKTQDQHQEKMLSGVVGE